MKYVQSSKGQSPKSVFPYSDKVGRSGAFVLLCNEESNKFSNKFTSNVDWTRNHRTVIPHTLYILIHFNGTSLPTKRVSHLPETPLPTSIVTREGPRRCDTCQKCTHPWQCTGECTEKNPQNYKTVASNIQMKQYNDVHHVNLVLHSYLC